MLDCCLHHIKIGEDVCTECQFQLIGGNFLNVLFGKLYGCIVNVNIELSKDLYCFMD